MRTTLPRYLEGQSKGFLLGLSYGLVALVCLIDLFTRPGITLAVFYFLPVSVAAYYVSRRAGLAVTLVCGLKNLWTEVATKDQFPFPRAIYWNAATFTASLFVVALLLAALRSAYEHERRDANSDFLTGAANFRAFFRLVDREMARCRRYGRPLSVAYLDIDDFKRVNDTRGHGAGDDLLRLVVSTLQQTLRETDTVARLGGDEFAILLPETDEEGARAAMEKAQATLRAAVKEHGYWVSFSVGVLTCKEPPLTVDTLLAQADQLAYDAKREGKDRVRYAVAA